MHDVSVDGRTGPFGRTTHAMSGNLSTGRRRYAVDPRCSGCNPGGFEAARAAAKSERPHVGRMYGWSIRTEPRGLTLAGPYLRIEDAVEVLAEGYTIPQFTDVIEMVPLKLGDEVFDLRNRAMLRITELREGA